MKKLSLLLLCCLTLTLVKGTVKVPASSGITESVSSRRSGTTSSQHILDGSQALRALIEKSDSGDVVALFHLARLYDTGYVTDADTIPRDTIRAMKLYEKAALLNYPPAQNIYGFRLYNGAGIKRNIRKGVDWMEKAALNGDVTAANNLGWLLLEGKGVKHDATKAGFWLQRASEAGVPSATSMLGDLYRRGEGVEKADTLKALSLYNLALEAGVRDAQLKILSMMGDKWSVLPPEEKLAIGLYYYHRNAPTIGVVLFEKASEEGNVDATALMGDALSRALGASYNHDKAIQYYFKAANAGHPSAQFVIAELLEMFPDALNELTDCDDLKIPQTWYDKAKAQGVRNAEEATIRLLNP